MSNRYDLGDLGAEIIGISGTITMLGMCVAPATFPGKGSTLSEETLENLIFAITKQLDRVAEEVNEWEGEVLRLKHELEMRAAG